MSDTISVLNMLNFLDSRGISRGEMMLYSEDEGITTCYHQNKKGDWYEGGTYDSGTGDKVNESK